MSLDPQQEYRDHVPEDEARYVRKRAQFVVRRYGFSSTQGEIIGWSDLGYSSSGIAEQIGVTASTVKSNMNRIDEQEPHALTVRTDDFDPDAEFRAA